MPILDAIGAVLHACEALAEAHSQGMVHRDIKPANLFLTTRADGSPCIKVLNFGISKVKSTSTTGLTRGTGVILGSVLYMSPEQLHSSKDVDARGDIWPCPTGSHAPRTRGSNSRVHHVHGRKDGPWVAHGVGHRWVAHGAGHRCDPSRRAREDPQAHGGLLHGGRRRRSGRCPRWPHAVPPRSLSSPRCRGASSPLGGLGSCPDTVRGNNTKSLRKVTPSGSGPVACRRDRSTTRTTTNCQAAGSRTSCGHCTAGASRRPPSPTSHPFTGQPQ